MPAPPAPLTPHTPLVDIVDRPLVSALSEFVRRTRPSLPAFVEMWRCQTPSDYRPNKQLVPELIKRTCASYDHLDRLLAYAESGVTVHLSSPLPVQTTRPPNHGSATERLPVLLRNLRTEQDAGRVLLLDLDILDVWPHIFISPFGVVSKSGADPDTTGRTIHDLSFPDGASVNSSTAQASLIPPAYQHCAAVATEILRLAKDSPRHEHPVLMAGDVASAFRHVGIHSRSVHLFAGRIPELNLLVIDLFCPFGWTGSPSCYEIAGAAISHVHANTATPSTSTNFSYHWVDDHICVTGANAAQCAAVETSLRRAMAVILGASAINEAKFTGWHRRLKILGLVFDTTTMTVSIPSNKIDKARLTVAEAFHSKFLTRTHFRSLLGTLRHVASCLRPARAFLQRLRVHERHLQRLSRVPVTEPMREDLRWWWSILAQPVLNQVPMTYFSALPPPDFTVEVDASDVGCCALDVTRRHFLRYDYNAEEANAIAALKLGSPTAYDINFRELLTCVFAASIWSPQWRSLSQSHPVHVHFRIDNTSAVSWQNRMASPNPRAQILIRLISWLEVQHGVRFSSSHIAGAHNVGADAGSGTSLINGTERGLAAYLRDHSVASSTYAKYSKALGRWEQWCALTRTNPWLLDVPPADKAACVSDFILFCIYRPDRPPIKSRTVAGVLHGVHHFFAARGLQYPLGDPQVRMLLSGLHRLDNPECRKTPVSLDLLRAVSSHLNFSSPADQALWGVLCVGFFFLLRKSEIVADGTRFMWFALRHSDVIVRDSDGRLTSSSTHAASVSIRLIGSKTNQNGSSVVRSLTRSNDPSICPVLGALCLRQAHGTLPDPLPAATFMTQTGKPAAVTTERLVQVLRTAAASIGVNPQSISSHSLRSGGATHMHRAGIEATTIQLHGRWASDAFKRYTRLCDDSVQVIAARMVSGSSSNVSLG